MRLKLVRDSQLWERAADPSALSDLIAHARRQVAVARRLHEADPTGDNPGIYGRELQRLGDALRVADDPEAVPTLRAALAIWDAYGKGRAAFLTRLKLTDALARNGVAVGETLDDLVEMTAREPFAIYRPFALQARGVHGWRTGTGGEADLREALAIQEGAGATRAAAATRALLATVQSEPVSDPS